MSLYSELPTLDTALLDKSGMDESWVTCDQAVWVCVFMVWEHSLIWISQFCIVWSTTVFADCVWAACGPRAMVWIGLVLDGDDESHFLGIMTKY